MILTFRTFFFVLLAALIVERFFNCSRFRNWQWVLGYYDIIDKRFAGKNSWFIVLLMLIPIALAVTIIEINLRLWLYGVLGILFEFVVLLYCFGPRSTWQDIETLKASSHTPEELQQILDVEVTKPEASLWLMFVRRILSPAFWFIFLGAGGVFLYRFTEVTARLLARKSESAIFRNRAYTLVTEFDWLPIRFFTLLFALVGHFAYVVKEWKKRVWSSPDENEMLLASCGDRAIGIADEHGPMEKTSFILEASALIERTLITFILIIAIIVIIV